MRFIVLIFIIVLSSGLYAQDTLVHPPVIQPMTRLPNPEVAVICLCDQEAEFPGGQYALQDYFNENLHLEHVPPLKDATTVYVYFVVDEKGGILKVEHIQTEIRPLQDAIEEAVITMPTWIPSMIGCCNYLKTRVRMPIHFVPGDPRFRG